MASANGSDILPSTGGESSATPGQTTNASTQPGGIDYSSATAAEAGRAGTEGVPAMPQPPANAADSVQDAGEDEADTPRAATLAAALPDPLGAAPQGEAQPSSTNGHVQNGTQGATNGLENSRRGSADPLFARRRAETGVRDIFSSLRK